MGEGSERKKEYVGKVSRGNREGRVIPPYTIITLYYTLPYNRPRSEAKISS